MMEKLKMVRGESEIKKGNSSRGSGFQLCVVCFVFKSFRFLLTNRM